MAKLVQFWYDRNKLLRGSIVWAVIFGLVLVAFWYVSQNVGFTSLSSAAVVNYIHLTIFCLMVAAIIMAFIGLGAELFGKRTKKEDAPTKMADGVWMIKK